MKVSNHRRGFPPHRAGVYGYTNYRIARKKGVLSGLSVDSIKYPEIYQELLRLGTIVSPDYDFNAIHVNHNVTCPPHKDDKNVGKSILVSIGDYTGSQFTSLYSHYNIYYSFYYHHHFHYHHFHHNNNQNREYHHCCH